METFHRQYYITVVFTIQANKNQDYPKLQVYFSGGGGGVVDSDDSAEWKQQQSFV